MDAFYYFLIQLGAIICVNSLFFILMLAFTCTIAVIQWYYSRKMQATLEAAIAETQAMLADPKLLTPFVKSTLEKLNKTFSGMLGNISKHGSKWILEAGGSPQQAGIFSSIIDFFGFKGKKAKALGGIAKYIDSKAVPPPGSVPPGQQEITIETLPTPEEYAKQYKTQMKPEQYKKEYAKQKKEFAKSQKK